MFTTTDCLVLFSIGFGENGSTLNQIISTGDMLNHAIISKNELETSLNILFQNQYISFDKDRFYATEKAKSFYRKYKMNSEGCIVEWIRISKIFAKQTFHPSEIITIKVTTANYNQALNGYYQAFKKSLKKLKILPLRARKNLLFWTSKKIKETK